MSAQQGLKPLGSFYSVFGIQVLRCGGAELLIAALRTDGPESQTGPGETRGESCGGPCGSLYEVLDSS